MKTPRKKTRKKSRRVTVPALCICLRPAREAGKVYPGQPPLSATACERCARAERMDWTKETCGSDDLHIPQRDVFWDVSNACDRALRRYGLEPSTFNRFPKSYVSRGHRVQRWLPEAVALASRSYWGIRGTGAALEIVELGNRSDLRRVRAYGTYDQMRTLVDVAMKTWAELPGGQEVETLFARMFPEPGPLVLEVEEPVTFTPAKRKRRKLKP